MCGALPENKHLNGIEKKHLKVICERRGKHILTVGVRIFVSFNFSVFKNQISFK